MVRQGAWLSRQTRQPTQRAALLRGLTGSQRPLREAQRCDFVLEGCGFELEVAFGENCCCLNLNRAQDRRSSLSFDHHFEAAAGSSVAAKGVMDVRRLGLPGSEGPTVEDSSDQESEVLAAGCLRSAILKEAVSEVACLAVWIRRCWPVVWVCRSAGERRPRLGGRLPPQY